MNRHRLIPYHRFFLRGLLLTLCLGLVAHTFAQLGSRPTYKIVGRKGNGQVIDLNFGDAVQINGKTYYVTASNQNPLSDQSGQAGPELPQKASVNGENVVLEKRPVLGVALYPATVFAVSGALVNSANSLTGGTRLTTGATLSFDEVLTAGKQSTVSLSGFYFRDYQGLTDLYQVAFSSFPRYSYGFQFAFLDSTLKSAPGATAHVILRFENQMAARSWKSPLQADLGIGIYSDFSPNYDFADGKYVVEQSVNFSTFFEASYEIAPNVSIVGSEWYVRDRNDDVNRFGIGLSFSF